MLLNLNDTLRAFASASTNLPKQKYIISQYVSLVNAEVPNLYKFALKMRTDEERKKQKYF